MLDETVERAMRLEAILRDDAPQAPESASEEEASDSASEEEASDSAK